MVSLAVRQVVGLYFANVDAAHFDDVLVIGDARVELAVADVERYDFGRSPAQQYVGEATGGGTDIQTFQAFRPGKAIAGKGFERAQEFVSASGDVVVALIHGAFACTIEQGDITVSPTVTGFAMRCQRP